MSRSNDHTPPERAGRCAHQAASARGSPAFCGAGAWFCGAGAWIWSAPGGWARGAPRGTMRRMPDENVFADRWDRELPDPPFRSRGRLVGRHAGATELGATVYEIDPGGVAAPYHLHHGNEELLIVLSGRPRLRTPAGERDLEPGAVVSFRRGPDGAHCLRNASDEPVRFVIVSTMRFPEVAEYPDTADTLTLTAPGEGKVFPQGSDVPYQEAVTAAAEAAGGAGRS